MVFLFNDLTTEERQALYNNLYETYLKSTGVITFDENTFGCKFADTIIVGNIDKGGFVIKKHIICDIEHYKLIALFSGWYKYLSELKDYIENISVYVFITDNLVSLFTKIGFIHVLQEELIDKYIDDDMVINHGVEQNIRNITFKKQLLVKLSVPKY